MRRYKSGLLSLFLSFSPLFLSSCRTVAHSPSGQSPGSIEDANQGRSDAAATPIILDPLSRALANGWDSEYQRKLSPCLAGDFVYRGAQASDLSFMRDYTYEQIMNETGSGLSGEASLFGLAAAKVEGEMARSLASTDESTSFIYHFSLFGKSAVLSERRFNAKGSIAYGKEDLLHFRDQCGDQFVEQVKLGGRLYIGVKYTFGSKETKDKVTLRTTLSLFWGLIKVSKSWTKEFRELMQDVRITIEAYQLGGDPQQLAALKRSVLEGSCAGDAPERCVAAVDRLLEYASKDFGEQLLDMQLSENADRGPAIIGIVLEDYKARKIFDPRSQKIVQVNVTASIRPENELRKALDRVDRLVINLKIAQGRMKILKEFKVNEADALVIEKSTRLIDETLQAFDVLVNSTCLRAQSNPSFYSNCLDAIKQLEISAREAVVPVNLSRANP